MEREAFDERLPALLDCARDQWGFDAQIKEEHWDFRVDLSQSPPKAKALLINNTRLVKTGQVEASVRVLPPVQEIQQRCTLVVSHKRSDQNPTRFTDFLDLLNLTFPKFCSEMQLDTILGLNLVYRNEIVKDRFPEFWSDATTLQLGKVLTLFAGPSSGSGQFSLPLSVNFTRVDKPASEFQSSIVMRTEQDALHDFKLAVLLGASWNGSKPKPVAECIPTLEICHGRVQTEFSSHFQKNAMTVFTTQKPE